MLSLLALPIGYSAMRTARDAAGGPQRLICQRQGLF